MKKLAILLIISQLTALCAFAQIDEINSTSGNYSSLVRLLGLSRQQFDGSFDPNLKALNIIPKLTLRPEDISAGNYIAPTLSGNFSQYLFGVKEDGNGNISEEKTLRGKYSVNLKIQSPQTTNDSTGSLGRFVASGGVGSMNGSFQIGAFAKGNTAGVTLTLKPLVGWQNGVSLGETENSNFAFFNGNGSLTAWAGPMVINSEVGFYKSFGEGGEFMQEEIDDALSLRINIALKVANAGEQDAWFIYGNFAFLKGYSSLGNTAIDFGISRTIEFLK